MNKRDINSGHSLIMAKPSSQLWIQHESHSILRVFIKLAWIFFRVFFQCKVKVKKRTGTRLTWTTSSRQQEIRLCWKRFVQIFGRKYLAAPWPLPFKSNCFTSLNKKSLATRQMNEICNYRRKAIQWKWKE